MANNTKIEFYDVTFSFIAGFSGTDQVSTLREKWPVSPNDFLRTKSWVFRKVGFKLNFKIKIQFDPWMIENIQRVEETWVLSTSCGYNLG